MGFAWNFIPSLGIGPFLAIGTAKILRCSAVSALAGNLGTGIFIPVYYSMNMMMGRLLTGDRIRVYEIEEILYESLQETIIAVEEIVEQPVRFFQLDRLQDFTVDFFIGGFVNALIAGSIMYTILLFIIKQRYKMRKGKEVINKESADKDTGTNKEERDN